MEDSIRVIFWILVGLVWFISAIAKKRQMGKGSIPGKRTLPKSGEGEVYQAPEEEMARFLKMFTGEEEPIPAQEPEPAFVHSEVEEIQAEEPLPVEPVEIEEISIPEEPSKPREAAFLPALSRLSISDLQRGIVLSEILMPPRAMRPHSYH
jgi:hypothetical protein